MRRRFQKLVQRNGSKIVQAFCICGFAAALFLTASFGDSAAIASQSAANPTSDTFSTAGAQAGASQLLSVNLASYDQAQTSESQLYATSASNPDSYGYTNLGIAQCDGNLNVRSTADQNSDIVGKMQNGAACEIEAMEGDWAKISSGKVSGYVMASYLVTGDAAESLAAGLVSTTAAVTADGVNVRQSPSTDSEVIGRLNNGAEMDVIGQSDDWIQIEFDGTSGYVSGDYIQITTGLPTAQTLDEIRYGMGVSDVRVDLVNYALQFVGNPYVWGGTSLTKGCDCSGFVLSIYKKYGFSLPHSSAAQAKYGTKVSVSEAQPGDLVFYGNGKRINHVGIYIGNGQIVAAASKRSGIKISSLYHRTPVTIRRLFTD